MRSKRIVLAVGGLMILASLYFLVPKRSEASGPLSVLVANKPTVTVGNTPSVSVANTPSVNVSNTPSVSVVAMPPVQTFFTPVQVSGNCTYSVGSSTCTVNGVYTVPAGSTLVVTNYSGVCSVVNNDYATVAAQLSVQTANGTPQTVTVPAMTSGGSILILNDWGQSLTFYGPSGTSVTVQLLSGGPQSEPVNCFYIVTGNLAPFAS